MNKLILIKNLKFASILFLLFLLGSCLESDPTLPEKGNRKLDCGGNLPYGYHCLTNRSGQTSIFQYNIPFLHSSWNNSSLDVCLTYYNNGTGTITYTGSGIVSGTNTGKIKWGVWVNSYGSPVLAANGKQYVFNQSISGAKVDPQIALIPYNQNTGKLEFGFNKGSCGNNGGGSSFGKAIFWVSKDYGIGQISVYVNGIYKGKITGYYSSGVPNCGVARCVNVKLPAGVYSYKARSQTGVTWSGSIRITSGRCFKIQLRK